MGDGLEFVVYDKAGAFKRQIGAHLEAHATLTRNVIPTAEFILDDDDPALPAATAKGARCAVWFRGAERLRGAIRAKEGAGPNGTTTLRVQGDLRKLWHWQGWPVPTASITAQTADVARYTGRTEQVFKAAIAANFARLGVPWSVAADHGLGTSGQRIEFRFHPLADKLIPLLEQDGLISFITYDGSGNLTVDIRAPSTVLGALSPESGIVDAYGWNIDDPTLTRVVVGGAGEGSARELAQFISTSREAAWGDIIEGFVDARNADAGGDLSPDGTQALAEGADRVGLSVDLVESPLLHYGTTFTEGDLLHVQVGPIDELIPILTVQIDDTRDKGVLVTPKLGELDANASMEIRLARQIARLAAGQRDQGRR